MSGKNPRVFALTASPEEIYKEEERARKLHAALREKALRNQGKTHA